VGWGGGLKGGAEEEAEGEGRRERGGGREVAGEGHARACCCFSAGRPTGESMNWRISSMSPVIPGSSVRRTMMPSVLSA
jgi:hypothetical protein